MTKRTLFIILSILILSTYSYCASKGQWGLSANNLIGNFQNENSNAGLGTQVQVPSVFYQFTDDFSAEFGLSLYQRGMRSGAEWNTTATYFKVLYNIANYARGKIMPHVGFSYINLPLNDDGDLAQVSGFNVIAGAEMGVAENISILMDMMVLHKADYISGDGLSKHYQYLMAFPFISLRWYI